MSPAATLVAPLTSPPLHQTLWACLRAWPRRSPAPPSRYHEPPPADAYRAILECDPAVQPETLARLYW